jgi:peptide methionine sulfoxide reductase MsrB
MGDILVMELYDITMKCSGCGSHFDQLFSMGPYNGNKDKEYYCLDCFAEAHGEEYDAE